MTSEKYNLGIIPIFYLFLSGSSNQEQKFDNKQSSDNEDDILQSALLENGRMNLNNQETKKN